MVDCHPAGLASARTRSAISRIATRLVDALPACKRSSFVSIYFSL
jgi:hypothetical protein